MITITTLLIESINNKDWSDIYVGTICIDIFGLLMTALTLDTYLRLVYT